VCVCVLGGGGLSRHLATARESPGVSGPFKRLEPSRCRSGREKSSAYHRNDLWVLSSTPLLHDAAAGGPGDSRRRPWVAVVRSCWHGPNPEGRWVQDGPGQASMWRVLRASQLGCGCPKGCMLASGVTSHHSLFSFLSIPFRFAPLHSVPFHIHFHSSAFPFQFSPGGRCIGAYHHAPWCCTVRGATHRRITRAVLCRVAVASVAPEAAAPPLVSVMHRMEVSFLSERPSGLGRAGQHVFALRGPEAAMELGMIDCLASLDAASLPMLPHLLQAPRAPAPAGDLEELGAADTASPDGALADVVARFRLNAGQRGVMEAITSWFAGSAAVRGLALGSAGLESPCVASLRCAAALQGPAVNPICIHGPFGSGKSSTLVAALLLILSHTGGVSGHLEGCAGEARILVASHTNVAVDRILLGLLEAGFTGTHPGPPCVCNLVRASWSLPLDGVDACRSPLA
jgi:AAA domain